MSRFSTPVVLSFVLALAGACFGCASTPDDGGGDMQGGGNAPPASGGSGTTGGGAGMSSTPSGGGSGGSGTSTPSGGAGGSGPSAGAGGGDVTGMSGSGGVGGAMGGSGGSGEAGMAGGGEAGMAGGGEAGAPAMHEDLGEGDGTDVVTIGDSYMNLSVGSGTEYSLDKITPTKYRHYAVPGTRILTGEIPGQWTSAKGQGDASTVIMTGGGNDIILDFFGNLLACQGAKTEADLSDACISALDEITAGVNDLIDQMKTDGVQDVVYIGYGYVTNNELGGTIERTKRVQGEMCLDDGSARGIRCHFVDPSQQLIGMIGGDGIHPTVAGYDVIAGMVWDKMVEQGVRR